MIEYAVQFIALSSLDYQSVWWRLFHAPNSAEWSNILVLAELLISLPASNGKLERVFSVLGTIKVDKCARLMNESLDDCDKTPLSSFNADPSIGLCLLKGEGLHRHQERTTDHAEAITRQPLRQKKTRVCSSDE